MSTLADKTDDQWAFPNQNDDQGMDVEDGKAEEDGMEVEGSDADSDDDANENDSGFKAKVIGVLKQYDYADKRSSKLTQNEFIHLLSVYNQAGIHFTSSKQYVMCLVCVGMRIQFCFEIFDCDFSLLTVLS